MRLHEIYEPMDIDDEPDGQQIRRDIRRILKAKGWHQVGRGFYSLVFTKRDHNRVRKVIAPEAEIVQGSANDLQSSFVEYVMKHRDNPHLPRFYKTSGMRVGQLPIGVYDMEKLRILSGENLLIVEAIVRAALENGTLRGAWDSLHGRYDSESPRWSRLYNHWPTFKQTYALLFQTLRDLKREGRRRGALLDIFRISGSENVMQRADGTPVVTDPWAA